MLEIMVFEATEGGKIVQSDGDLIMRRTETLAEDRGTVWSMAWSPDKSLLAVGSSHGGLAIWNLPRIKSELSRIGLGW